MTPPGQGQVPAGFQIILEKEQRTGAALSRDRSQAISPQADVSQKETPECVLPSRLTRPGLTLWGQGLCETLGLRCHQRLHKILSPASPAPAKPASWILCLSSPPPGHFSSHAYLGPQ